VIILGIDPGSVVTGYGYVEVGRRHRLVDAGCIRPGNNESFERRLLGIHEQFEDLVQRRRPDAVAVEAAFHGANVQTLMKMCHARGTILTAVARAGVEFFEYAPREVKKAVVGNGNASKEQVRFMVEKVLGSVGDRAPLDVTDAVAVALCHAHRHGRPGPVGGEKDLPSIADRLIAAGADPAQARRFAK
tara:strand:+ start:1175 stop:1741 length:567 start_codon:yes stop_codon:yes gene_type:complete